MIRSILAALMLIAGTSLFVYAFLLSHLNLPGNENTSSMTPQRSGGGSISGRIDAQGHFVVTNLSAGVYSLRLLPRMPRTFGEDRKIISEALHRAEQKVVVSENSQQAI